MKRKKSKKIISSRLKKNAPCIWDVSCVVHYEQNVHNRNANLIYRNIKCVCILGFLFNDKVN